MVKMNNYQGDMHRYIGQNKINVVQAKFEAFSARFPDAEDLGVGLCSTRACTSPWKLAAGLTPSTAQTETENWCGVVQEVALDVPTIGALPAHVSSHQHSASVYRSATSQCVCFSRYIS